MTSETPTGIRADAAGDGRRRPHSVSPRGCRRCRPLPTMSCRTAVASKPPPRLRAVVADHDLPSSLSGRSAARPVRWRRSGQRRIVSRSAIRAGSPYAFHRSAYLAVVRERLARPGTADQDRQPRLHHPGAGLHVTASRASGRPGRRASPLAVEQAPDEPGPPRRWRSSRSPKPAPKSSPNASCSRSNQPAPRPRMARPSLRWSRVVGRAWPSGPGLRAALAADQEPQPRARRQLRPGRRGSASPRASRRSSRPRRPAGGRPPRASREAGRLDAVAPHRRSAGPGRAVDPRSCGPNRTARAYRVRTRLCASARA